MHNDAISPTNQVVMHMVPASHHELSHGPDFLELFSIVRRRIRSILAVTIAGAVIAALAALMIPPKYTAKAQLVVEPEPTTRIGSAPARISPVDQMAVDTQVTMLNAREFLRRVLTSLKQDDRAATSNSKNAKSTGSASPRHIPVAAHLRQKLIATKFDDFVKNLSVIQELNSRVITVRYTSTSAQEAAIVANRTVRLYLENMKVKRSAYLRNQIDSLGRRISQLQNAGGAADGVPGIGDPAQLQDAEVNTQTLVVLQRRRQEIRDLLETIGPGASILSTAVPPQKRSSFNPLLFILPATMLFFIASTLYAVAKEQTDRSFRSERDINNTLGIPCIGQVPKLPNIGDARTHTHLLRKPLSPYAQAVRSIIAQLQWAPDARNSKVVVLTSSVPDEGKTELAVSLAVYAASIQKRVILLDLDFSNPTLIEELEVGRTQGIASLVLKNVPLGKVIKRHQKLKLDYLPMAKQPIDPLPLFADGGLEQVLAELGNRYDLIVIDGPPVLASTGASLLAALADRVLFVVKWADTRRDLAQNAMKDLCKSALGSRKIAERTSAIVTQVDLEEHAKYRFGDAAEILAHARADNAQSTQAFSFSNRFQAKK